MPSEVTPPLANIAFVLDNIQGYETITSITSIFSNIAPPTNRTLTIKSIITDTKNITLKKEANEFRNRDNRRPNGFDNYFKHKEI